MSYTTVLRLTPGSSASDAVLTLKELSNSWGSAIVIWEEMCFKYYGTKSFMFDGTIEKLHPRYKDLSIPEFQRAVLLITYDRAYVSKENYKRASSDIRKWLNEFPPKDGYANHWEEIAEIYESNPDCDAIGLHCTSVSENPFIDGYDEETEDLIPINWDSAFEIYTTLDKFK